MNPKVIKDFNLSKDAKPSHIRLFEELDSQPDASVPVEKSLLIFCTPRCGSTLFCEALNSTGLLGVAEEWFNYEYFDAWMKATGKPAFNLVEYTDWLWAKTTKDTGVWCLKWHIGQLVAMNDDFNLGLETMEFSHAVYLYRRDKLAQAASLVRAVATDCFRSTEEETKPFTITRAGMAAALENIVRYDEFTRKYLWKFIDKSYAYEDFRQLTTPQTKANHCYNETLKALGKPRSPRFYVDKIKRQADHRNAKAAKDFRSYILGEIE